MLDRIAIRAHACAAEARQSTGEQALGRSRGGFSTMNGRMALHPASIGSRSRRTWRAAPACRRPWPAAPHLTGGERHDLLGMVPLFEQAALRTGRRGRPRWKPDGVLADKD
jgi:hypothetical protein